MRALFVVLAFPMLTSSGCDLNSDKIRGLEKEKQEISKLEMENQELREKENELIEKMGQKPSYDTSAKCANDARKWFNAAWTNKGAIFLNFSSHYNKVHDSCFALVENHSGWTDTASLWNVRENDKLAEVYDTHRPNPDGSFREDFRSCSVAGPQCKTVAEFLRLIQPYMRN